MESVSFESENHGLQVGINHGVISNRISHARVVQTTRTGAVFNGDISAGRDINISM